MGKIKYNRGTTYSLTHTYQKNGQPSDDGQTLMLTVKQDQYDNSDDDSTAILKKDVPMNGSENTVTILPNDIDESVEPGDYYFDLKVKESSSVILMADWGEFELVATPTNRL